MAQGTAAVTRDAGAASAVAALVDRARRLAEDRPEGADLSGAFREKQGG